MTPELRGETFRSNPETFELGASKTFKMDFLAQARQMTAPEVHNITVRFTGTVGGVTATALGRDAAKLYDTIRFKDFDEVLNASGAGLRVHSQMEYGSRMRDPADIGSAATNASYVYQMRIPIAPYRAERGADYAIPLAHFLEGGEFTIQMAAAVPTGWAAIQNDWKVRLMFDVRDARVRELKSRRQIREVAVTQQEFDYQINGFARAIILTSKLATTGYTSLAGFTTIYSRTLNTPPSFETSMLLEEYEREAVALNYTDDEFARSTPGAIALVAPRDYQLAGKMIDTKTFHLDLLQAAPASGRLLTDTLIDRSGEGAALTEGFPSPGELQRAVMKSGEIQGASGKTYPVSGFNAPLARKLPVRLK